MRVAPVIGLIGLAAGAFGQAVVSQASDRAPLARAALAAPASPAQATAGSAGVHHYEYVFRPGEMYVYDMDNAQQLVEHITGLPDVDGVRGVMVSPSTHILYISHGGDGGQFGTGSLLAYDLTTGNVLWNRSYPFGVDSGAITPDGKTIYMPTGENESSGVWNVLEAASGNPIGSITGGSGAHNTITSLDGRYVYLGGRQHNYLDVVSTAADRVVREVGPLEGDVRPFTVNGTNTLAFTTASEFLGFQVSSITTGQVLYTLPIPGFELPHGFPLSAPSHGITLTPDEQRLFVIDAPYDDVHVFDVSGLPARAPTLLASIKLSSIAGEESPCPYDCAKDGWLQASRDGRFVYVGDSGDVIDTRSLTIVATLAPLAQTRQMLEIDWARGVPVATSTRYGLGYVTEAAGQPASGLAPAPPGSPSSRALAVIGALTISPKSFKAARSDATVPHGAGSGGAIVRYSDSLPASTAFTVLEPRPGIESRTRGCVKLPRASHPAHLRRCTRYVTLGGFAHRDRQGSNSLRFSGWVARHKLAPGPYRLQALPTFGGRRGAQRLAGFRILR